MTISTSVLCTKWYSRADLRGYGASDYNGLSLNNFFIVPEIWTDTYVFALQLPILLEIDMNTRHRDTTSDVSFQILWRQSCLHYIDFLRINPWNYSFDKPSENWYIYKLTNSVKSETRYNSVYTNISGTSSVQIELWWIIKELI